MGEGFLFGQFCLIIEVQRRKGVGVAELKWRSWPLMDSGAEGWIRAAIALILLTIIFFILAISLPLVAAGALALALLLALSPFFTPSYFNLKDSELVIARVAGLLSRRRDWSAFIGCRATPKGYWLLPPNPTAPLTPLFRALFLPLPTDKTLQSELRKILEERFPIL
jgi:hypothetical protein